MTLTAIFMIWGAVYGAARGVVAFARMLTLDLAQKTRDACVAVTVAALGVIMSHRLSDEGRRERLRARNQAKKKRRKKRELFFKQRRKKRQNYTPPATEVINLGPEIDIYNPHNRGILARQCEVIRRSTKPIELVFGDSQKPVETIFAAGMLLLYAEVYRKTLKMPTVGVNCDYPKVRKTEKVLQHIDFFKMLGKEERISTADITEEDIRSWRVTKGTRFDGEEVSDFLESIIGMDERHQKNLYISVMEAIGNCAEHAYVGKLKDIKEDEKFWVMFGRINEDNSLTVVVGDLGAGIPVTLKHRSDFENIKEFAVGLFKITVRKFLGSDSALICAATRLGESRKWQGHRGKGLGQAVEKINQIGGKMSIYSLRGEVLAEPGKKPIARGDLQNGVKGTIIQITVPTNRAEETSQ